MSLPRYAEYKDSGVAWLGPMPSHWDLVRYKGIFKEREERSVEGSETLLSVSAYTGVSPRSEIIGDGDHLSRAESLEGYKVCYPDDLVMNIMLAWNRGLGFSPMHGIVSPAYCVFSVRDNSDPRFLNYLVRSDRVNMYFKAHSSGVIESRLRLYPDSFGALFCARPPLEEQSAIAAFLDRETGKIDALIAEQEKLLTLLAEKRQATISHAVTRGLNPNVSMKDSGVFWLGEVPTHWIVRRMKHLIGEGIAGPYGSSLTKSMYVGEGYRVYGQQQVIPNDFSVGDYYISEEKFSEMHRYKVMAGDVLVSVMGTIGQAALVPDGVEPGIINPRLVLYRVIKEVISPRYLQVFLNNPTSQKYFSLAAQGTTMDGLNMGSIGELWVAVPPCDEQNEILDFVENEVGRIARLVLDAERAIALLKERRSALIAAAVTGKIDVRSTSQMGEEA